MKLLYLSLWILLPTGCLLEYTTKTTNIVCQPNEKYIRDTKCSLKAVSWEKSLIQMDCHLKVPFRNPTIHFEMFKKDYTNQYQPFLINVTFSACDIISRRNFLPYGAQMWRTLKKFTNVNHSCPFVGHMYARDMTLEHFRFPHTMPAGNFLAITNFNEKLPQGARVSYGVVKWYFSVNQKELN